MSHDVIIRAEQVGKLYRLGETLEMFGNFREVVMGWPRRLMGRRAKPDPAAEEQKLLWALRDVSFEIHRGDVVGVIGRNGAGKSTLLKILSQITNPTEGKVDIYGRLSSLLEVGTGFHPELTGRENIYLNGSILGMSKAEIDRNFDEIVAFAEIEKFLDTPVKRYSSGMYVRLAFAVAAHLQPEVLVVDEVLAVGDQAFQRKCLGKMRDIGSGGRTVLFVSHNLAAVQALCNKALYLEKGRLLQLGECRPVVEDYISREPTDVAVSLRDRTDRRGDGSIRLVAVRAINNVNDGSLIRSGDSIRFEVDYESDRPWADLNFYLGIDSTFADNLIIFFSKEAGLDTAAFPARGRFTVSIDRLPLPPATYRIRTHLYRAGQAVDLIDDAMLLNVEGGDFFGTGQTANLKWSTFLVDQQWKLEALQPEPAEAGMA